MIKNRNLVIVGLQPWDIEIGSNCKNIAMEFARYNRVLYVNPPLDYKTLVKDRNSPKTKRRLAIRKTGQHLVEVMPNLWNYYPESIIHSINWIPFLPIFRIGNKLNNRIFSRDIRKVLGQLGFGEFILFNDSDMFRSYHLPEMLSPLCSVYYTRDNLLSQPYFFRHGRFLEPEIMNKYSLVAANSPYLQKIASTYNQHAYYVGQGCDLKVFDGNSSYDIPEDISSIPGPIVGYIGVLSSQRLDIALLEELCSGKSDCSFVFIGRQDGDFAKSRLNTMPNVYFLGLKPEHQLPAYLAKFDVAFNPQLINDMTIGNYPRKIDEYLSMGKPVVATQTETMRIFEDFVYLGVTAEEYIENIDRALNETDAGLPGARMAFAHSHTWENSAALISDALRSFLSDH